MLYRDHEIERSIVLASNRSQEIIGLQESMGPRKA